MNDVPGTSRAPSPDPRAELAASIERTLHEQARRAVTKLARKRAVPVAQVVRDSLRRAAAEDAERLPEDRIAAVLRFARFSGPTGDIERILAEIEHGRGPL